MLECQHCHGPLEACRLGCLKATLALPAPAPAPDTLPADEACAVCGARATRRAVDANVYWCDAHANDEQWRPTVPWPLGRLAAPDAEAGLEALAAGMSYDPGLMTRDPVAFARVATGYLTRAAAHGAAEERAKLLQACEWLYEVRAEFLMLGRDWSFKARSVTAACQERDAERARREAAERALADAQAEFACAETGLELQAQAHAARAETAERERDQAKARVQQLVEQSDAETQRAEEAEQKLSRLADAAEQVIRWAQGRAYVGPFLRLAAALRAARG